VVRRTVGGTPILAFCLVLAGVLPARAAHVIPMNLATMADHSAQVIVGEVVAARSYWAENPRRIETEYTLHDVSYLKGTPADASDAFTLVLPGGKVGEVQARLCCAPQPTVGQRWCLFLLPSSPTWPIVGLYQGALRIAEDASGVERMMTADGLAVQGVDADGFVQHRSNAGHATAPIVREANHVRIVPRSTAKIESNSAMTFEAFRATLQPILDASQAYALAGPAGRYTPKRLTATTLKTATRDNAAQRSADIHAAEQLRGANAVERKTPPAREEVAK
jgi:hypothetical protein